MQLFKRWPVRVLAFVVIFFLLLGIMDFLFVPINNRQLFISHDFLNTPDMDIVTIGNSLCLNNIDPWKLEERTGLRCINYGTISARAQSHVAMAREAFHVKNPKYLIVVYDPMIQFRSKEDTAVMSRFSPLLSDPWMRICYLLDELEFDISDMNRVFLWKASPEKNIDTIKQNARIKLGSIPRADYDRELLKYNNDIHEYMGRGFFMMNNEINVKDIQSESRSRKKIVDEPLIERISQSFKRIKNMCDKNDCQMIVVTTPIIQNVALTYGRYISSMRSMEAFCQEEGIPYLNFTYAQGRSLPDMTGYFYDSGNHFVRTGNAIFNEVFADVICDYINGKDVSSYFYTEEEWRASIDKITDLWFVRKESKGKQTYTAYTTHGTPVKPEYQFVTIDETGRESILQDYSSANTFSIASADIQGRIKVYARNASDDSQKPMAYTE